MKQPRARSPAPGPAARRARKPVQAPNPSQTARRVVAEHRPVDAAIRLIAQHGIKGTTLGEVGEAAGYSSGLTAHHYKTKNGLIRAVMAEIHRRYMAMLAEAGLPEPGLGRLLASVDVYLMAGDAVVSRAFAQIQKEALIERSQLAGTLRKFNRTAIDGIARQIRVGIDKGEIRPDVDPAVEATLILAALRGARTLWVQLDGAVELDRVAHGLKAQLRRSLAV
jgi:AcrR family transcriptional regulator